MNQPTSREPDDETVAKFIAWFEKENREIFSHVLNWIALNAHLALYMASSPIRDIDPICRSFIRHVHMFDPSLDMHRAAALRHAAQKRLSEDGHIQRYMKYEPPRGPNVDRTKLH